VRCHYCGDAAEKVTGDVVYPHLPHLKRLVFWRCEPCGARVGTHSDSGEPLGTLAKEDLRHLRQEAHEVLDSMWRKNKGGLLVRGFVYTWLKKRLGADSTPHIGSMDEKQCLELIALRAEIEANTKAMKKIWGVS
jgi:hypothetical protein